MPALIAFAVAVGLLLIYIGVLKGRGVLWTGEKPRVEKIAKTQEQLEAKAKKAPSKKKKKKKGPLDKLQARFERKFRKANWDITFRNYVLQRVLMVVVLTAALTIILRSNFVIWFVVSLVTVLLVSHIRLETRIKKRKGDYELVLENLLIFTMHNLQADMPFPLSLGEAAKRVDEPVKSEVAEVLLEHKMGKPLDKAMDEWAESVDSDEVRLFCGAYKVAQAYGGRQLRSVIDNIAESVRTKNRKKGQLQSAIAEQRLAAGILAAAVPVISFVMIMSTPEMKHQLLGTTSGIILFFVAAALEVAGILVMYKLIDRIQI